MRIVSGWAGARRAPSQADLGLEPRRVEVPNEDEGKDDEEEHDARQEDEEAEDTADVGLERDIAEAEGAHHGEGPVDARDPRMPLPLDVRHDEVEDHRVDYHDRGQDEQIADKRRDVPLHVSLAHHRGQERARQVFHRPPALK